MKKILLFVFALLSVAASAQYVEKVAEFDFTKPEELVSDPPITFMEGSLDYRLNDKKLYANDGDVIMCFTDAGNGVIYNNQEYESGVLYYMQIRSWAEMEIKLGRNGYELRKIEFTGYVGALGNVNSVDNTWYCYDDHVSSVFFKNGSTVSQITKVRVTYMKKAEKLELESPKPSSAFEGSSFKSIPLSFNQTVTIEKSKQVMAYPIDNRHHRLDDKGIELDANLDPSKNYIVVLSTTAEVPNGLYEISIPDGTFRSEFNVYNTAITLYYNYDGKLEFPTISPYFEESTFFSVPKEVILMFNESVHLSNKKGLGAPVLESLFDGAIYDASLNQLDLDDNQVRLVLNEEMDSVISMQQGDWEYTIPDGLILSNSNENLGNAKITIKYVVENTHELLDEAWALYDRSLKGGLAIVGYPNMETKGREALYNVLYGSKKYSYQEIKAAINIFCQETDVMKPVNEKWYQIAGVCGNEIKYLKYHKGEISLTNEEKDAASFKVISKEGKTAFMTNDGMYLQIVKETSELGMNLKTGKEQQDILLDKLIVENDTIEGLLQMNVPEELYATIQFADSISRGFMFKESNEDANKIKPQLRLSKTKILEAGEELILTVENVDKAILVDQYDPYFSKDGTKVHTYGPILIKTDKADNEFYVQTTELTSAGKYQIVILDGVLAFFKGGYNADEFEKGDLIVEFSIEKANSEPQDTDLPNYNFNYNKYNVLQYLIKDVDNMQSTDLNDIIIFSYTDEYSGLKPDTTKTVSIVKYYGKTVVASGHFIEYPEFGEKYGYTNTWAIILKLDKEFEKGDLKYSKGLYNLVVPAAAFGDANFGKFIDPNVPDSEKPRPEECRVNAQYESFTFYVDDSNVDKEYPSSETMSLALQLDKISGIGYPSSDCPARKSLEALVDKREGSEEKFINAINNFYSTAYVTMPEKGKYYRISAVSDGMAVYLDYNGEKVGLTTEASKATGFMAMPNDDGSFSLLTGDGRYLCQPSTENNVSNEAVSITLTKLLIDGIDPVKTFGLFSIKADGAYAQVDAKEAKFLAAANELNLFSAEQTCGFKLENVEKKDITAPNLVSSLVLDPVKGAYLRELKTVTVKFNCFVKVELADVNKIKLIDNESNEVGEVSANAVEGVTNEFLITFKDLPKSPLFTLMVEEGAFTFTFAEMNRPVKSFIANFNIVDETSIRDIYISEYDEPLFDLQGRKVTGNLKPGIYIKNGKKLYIK